MPVNQGGVGCFLRFEKVEVRYQVPKKFVFRMVHVVSLHLLKLFDEKTNFPV